MVRISLHSLIPIKVEASEGNWGGATVKCSHCAGIGGDHLVDSIARVVVYFPC